MKIERGSIWIGKTWTGKVEVLSVRNGKVRFLILADNIEDSGSVEEFLHFYQPSRLSEVA